MRDAPDTLFCYCAISFSVFDDYGESAMIGFCLMFEIFIE
jgi:hypothetical protein